MVIKKFTYIMKNVHRIRESNPSMYGYLKLEPLADRYCNQNDKLLFSQFTLSNKSMSVKKLPITYDIIGVLTFWLLGEARWSRPLIFCSTTQRSEVRSRARRDLAMCNKISFNHAISRGFLARLHVLYILDGFDIHDVDGGQSPWQCQMWSHLGSGRLHILSKLSILHV